MGLSRSSTDLAQVFQVICKFCPPCCVTSGTVLCLCAQLILDPWTLRLPGSPTMQGWVTVAV